MQLPSIDNRLIIIIGPTGIGKTAIAIKLAKILDGEIISADSRSFYRGMDIGTAKPSIDERRFVKHHMIDCADPDKMISLAEFQNDVNNIIENIYMRNKTPILVGGTGQYIRSIIEGWNPPLQAPDLELRTVLENWAAKIGPDKFHEKLMKIDPSAANKIDPNNIRRTIRAFEVIFHSGKKFSDQKEKKPSKYNYIMIGLNTSRIKLYERIDNRIENMIKQGLINEMDSLLKQGYSKDLPAFSAIGYFEAIKYIDDEISIEEVKLLMKRRTRQYVRRQANWFKPDDNKINWFDIDNLDISDIFEKVTNLNHWVLSGN